MIAFQDTAIKVLIEGHVINVPDNLSYIWHRFKSFNIHTTNMCTIGLNCVAIKSHLNVFTLSLVLSF